MMSHISGVSPASETVPPVPPAPATYSYRHKGMNMNRSTLRRCSSSVSTATMDTWERLFDQGYKTDITINTEGGAVIYAHASVLGMASPVMKGMISQSKNPGRQQSISIHGVPHDAVRVFIRFLYSSRYEKEDMEDFVVNLLVLSHVFMVPHLKRECEHQLVEQGLLTIENVVDVFQLALLCDAAQLNLACHRMITKNLKAVKDTEGWEAMKKSHPVLEKELLESISQIENAQKERIRKKEERVVYLQLYEVMEALVHICRDGCKTIGPCDKDFNEDQAPCRYVACKRLELLVRHFAGCKLRVPGGCIHCKRTWQLLELHSRLCADSDACRVPLCGNFKERARKQSNKDVIKWKILARRILTTKNIARAPFFSPATARSS